MKMKRMSIAEIRNEFTEISKAEQVLYVGGTKYNITNDGDFGVAIDDGNDLYDTIVTKDGYSISLPAGTVYRSKGDKIMPGSDAKQLFEFVADHTEVEWGMSIREDGTAKVYTNQENDRVDLKISKDTTQVVHSHTKKLALSDEDRRNADAYPNITHTVYFENKYRDFEYAGYKNEYDDPFEDEYDG